MNPETTVDNRHKLALPHWARPGFSSIVQPDDGGGNDDEQLDDDEGDDEDLEDDDPDADKTEAELRAELAAARRAIKAANDSSASKRGKLKAARARVAALEAAGVGGKSKPDGDDDGAVDLDAVRAQATRAATVAANGRIIKAEARGSLKAAGIDPKRVERAVGLLSLDDIDVDDDGTVEGLDEAIDDLRREWPELFAAAPGRRRRSVAGDDDRDGAKRSGPKLTPSQQQAKALLG